MDITLFLKIVKRLGSHNLDDFVCTINNKIYGFKNVGDDSWDDQGKYQYKYEKGQLIETDEHYNEIQSFNFGVTRSVQRSGSYFTDYHYNNEPYEFFEIKEVLIPEEIKIIPAHTENKWNELNIDLNNIIDEEEEERKRVEAEKLRLKEEAKLEKERLSKLYTMNKYDIIQRVNKKLKKNRQKFTIEDMRKEYFDIVVNEGLENQEWIDYHKGLQENLQKDGN
jgi:hypothetical protein